MEPQAGLIKQIKEEVRKVVKDAWYEGYETGVDVLRDCSQAVYKLDNEYWGESKTLKSFEED